MCSIGTIPIRVRSCFPVGLGFSYQVQAYTNIGNTVGTPVALNTSIINNICVPFFAGPAFVGIQAVSLQSGQIVQTSNLVLVEAGREIVFTIQNDSLHILGPDESCDGKKCCPTEPCCCVECQPKPCEKPKPCPPKPCEKPKPCPKPCPPEPKPCKKHENLVCTCKTKKQPCKEIDSVFSKFDKRFKLCPKHRQ